MMYGSKIENLIKLKNNNINVPNFIVLENSNDLEKIKDLKDTLYAVRSSCNIEDGNTDSFAGLFDTYLNINKDNLKENILKCFDSVNNKNIKEYAKKNSIDISNIKMNVIVQEMVSSKISGVLFTSNPQGIINEAVIVVSKGLGENVVQDKSDVTSYYYNLTDKVYYYEGKDILKKELLEKLLEVSLKIKDILGDYLDIEFGIDNNEIYILQARKITTINDNKLIVLDNSNIVESYPNISSTMTASFVNFIYSTIFTKLVYRVLKSEKDRKSIKPTLDNMTAYANGRMYYQISNWYSLIKYLPFSKKIIPIWQEMMGVKIKDSSSKKTKVSILSKISVMFNYVRELINSQKNMEKLNNEFLEIEKYFNETFNDNLSNEEYIKIYNTLKEKAFNNWDITLINDMYAFLYTGILKKKLKKKFPDTYEAVTNDYISGISNIESLKPIKELINLAFKEKDYTKSEFELKKKKYINLYGDRSLEELKLESETFRTNESLLDEKIKEYQKDRDKLAIIYNSLNKEKENIKETRIIKKVTSGIKNREISRLNRSRLFGMVRSIILAMGNNLVKNKIIERKEDVFYLTIEELFNIKESKDYKKLINNRKEELNNYKKLPSYSRIIYTDKIFNKTIKDINKNTNNSKINVISGTPSSFGITEGEAVVISDVTSKIDSKDKILVTKMTDPGWVFLIANAKGIISEKGSLLSHTSIISRELGIPSIVGIENLLDIIHTGDYIKMDANTGKIEIIKRNKQNENSKI